MKERRGWRKRKESGERHMILALKCYLRLRTRSKRINYLHSNNKRESLSSRVLPVLTNQQSVD
jgi:hypothetical protein